MKTTLAILASMYWIFFFTDVPGLYLEHFFTLAVASCLTIFVVFSDLTECGLLGNKQKKEEAGK